MATWKTRFTSKALPKIFCKKMAKRNFYRNLVIEFYARNSSSVLAITHKRWPEQPWTSQPQLARLLSAETGCDLDYRSLSRQLKRVQPFDRKVTERIREIIRE